MDDRAVIVPAQRFLQHVYPVQCMNSVLVCQELLLLGHRAQLNSKF